MNNATGLFRYALRQFARSPAWTLTAIVTLALGIGGTTAIFSLIQTVMLKSLPVADPSSLYRIGDGTECCVESGPQDPWGMFSFPLFEKFKAAVPEFEEVAAFQAGPGLVSVRRERVREAPQSLRLEYVTGNYFSTFGVGAAGGRLFAPEDDTPSSPPVAVLSHHAWQGAFNADPSVVGSVLVVQGTPVTVVGVAAAGFFGDTLRSDPSDLWIPVQQEPLLDGEGALLHQKLPAWLRVIGRLRPGASIDGVAPRLSGLLRQWMQYEAGYPSNWMPDIMRVLPKQSVAVVPAGGGVGVMKENYAQSLQILLTVCGLVLLIACANVANLLLARATGLRTQTAVRLAIGATSRHIVAQALVESLLLAIGGAALGLLVAVGTSSILLALAFTHAHFLPISARPSLPVLAFACALALVTGAVFGSIPAWVATRTDPIDALRGAGRGTSDRSSGLRQTLVIVQATLSVVLVAGATMLGRSLGNLEHQNFGYRTDGRVVVSVSQLPAAYSLDKLNAVYRSVEDRLTSLPGVHGAGLALYNPLTNNWGELILVSGHPQPTDSSQSGASWDRVSTHYLENFGMTIERGRTFTDADNETSAPVAIVNDRFVKRFFKSGEDPIDQHFGLDLPQNAGTFRIIGVVNDAKFAGWGLDQPAQPMFYVPLTQTVDYHDALMARVEVQSHFIGGMVLVTTIPAGTLEPVIRRTLAEVDPNLTVISVRPMSQQVALSFDGDRAVATLASLFGVVALLLAAVGLYGLLANNVASRRNEIGVRMALGADRVNVIGLVLRGAFLRVVAGLVLGVPLAIGAGRLIGAQLYGVSSWDPVALAVACGALGLCALVASLVPARRASSIAPMNVLREG